MIPENQFHLKEKEKVFIFTPTVSSSLQVFSLRIQISSLDTIHDQNIKYSFFHFLLFRTFFCF